MCSRTVAAGDVKTSIIAMPFVNSICCSFPVTCCKSDRWPLCESCDWTNSQFSASLKIPSVRVTWRSRCFQAGIARPVGYGVKRMVDVPITSLGCTTQQEADDFGCERGKEIVAGHRGLLKDSCRGDSVAPCI